MGSPIHDMEGVVLDFGPHGDQAPIFSTVPQIPPSGMDAIPCQTRKNRAGKAFEPARPLTLAAMSGLLDQKLAPSRMTVDTLQAKIAELQDSLGERHGKHRK